MGQPQPATPHDLLPGISLSAERRDTATAIESGKMPLFIQSDRMNLIKNALCRLLRAEVGDKYYDIKDDTFRTYTP